MVFERNEHAVAQIDRGRSLEEEHHRERVLRLRLQFPLRRKEEIKQDR
jgi:hypothetical protein